MDRVGADFFRTVSMLKDRLKANPLVLQLPVGEEDGFKGVVDLLNMKMIVWESDAPDAPFKTCDVDETILETAGEYREKLIEQVAEVDDEIMEAFLEETPVSTDELLLAIRRATLDLKLVPVLCGAALRNKGIQLLLEAVVNFLPSPVDVPPIQGEHPDTGELSFYSSNEKGPLVALIFKVAMIEGRKLSYVRVYSGKLVAGGEVYNPFRGKKEKIARILRMHANKRERIDSAGSGSIVGVVGLKDSSTGETLCDSASPVVLEKMEFFKPVISISVEPKTRDDQGKLDQVMQKLMAEDPTLNVRQDEDTGQTILSGMGELHLDVIISRMKREFKTNVNVGKPQVVYRETLAKSAVASAAFDREVAGQRHFGEVEVTLRPLARGVGNLFEVKVADDIIPESFFPAVEKGIKEAMEYGALMGYPLVDVQAEFTGGGFKESLGSDLAFSVAASMACREAFVKAEPYLLEPIMDVDVFVPESFTGEVIGDLNARSGKIESISAEADSQTIRARVPLSKMFGYSTALRSASQGRGTFTMKFSNFDQV